MTPPKSPPKVSAVPPESDIPELPPQLTPDEYRLMIENINDIIFYVDLNGTLNYISPVVEKLLGYSAADLTGQPFHKFIAAEDLPGLMEEFEETLRGRLRSYEFRVVKKDGSLLDVRTSSRPRLIQGRPVGLIGVLIDISASKRIEAERARAEEEVRRLNNELERKVADRTAALDGLNRLLRLLGRGKQAVLQATGEENLLLLMGRAIVEAGRFPRVWIGLTEPRRPGLIGTIARAVLEPEGRAPEAGADADLGVEKGLAEEALRTRSAVLRGDLPNPPASPEAGPAARQSAALPLITAEGEVLGALVVFGSRTGDFPEDEINVLSELAGDLAQGIGAWRVRRARALAEEALQESEGRLMDIIEFLPDATFVIGKDGRVMAWNKAIETMTGVPKSDMLGQGDYAYAAPFYGRRRPVLIDLIGKPESEWRKQYESVREADGRLFAEVHVPLLGGGRGADLWMTASPLLDRQGGLVGAIESIRDISERKRMERVQTALYGLSEAAQSAATLDALYVAIHEIIGRLMPAENFFIALLDPAAGLLNFPYHRDEIDPDWFPIPPGKSLTGYVLSTGEPLLAAAEALKALEEAGRIEQVGAPSVDWLGVPLKTRKGELIGVMAVQTYNERIRLDAEDKNVLVFVSTQVAMAIERKRTEEALQSEEERSREGVVKLRATLKASIKALSSAIETRDPYTSGHQEGVTRLAAAIGREMGLSEDRLEGLQIAGIIHDIGKLQIPAEILSKPSRLTEIEYILVKTHAEAGFKILSNIEFPWPIAQIVYQHHERFDGSGYPRGLRGEEILVEARILEVADVVEAMSSHRPYRPALGTEAALKEIAQHQGTRFDPQVVAACLRLFVEKGFRL